MSLTSVEADRLAQVEHHRAWTQGVRGVFYRVTQRAVRRALETVEGLQLDMGCGDDMLLETDRAPRVLIDLSRVHLARCEGGKKVCGDATRLPFRSGCFGAVVLHAILEHLADPRAALRETRRTLKRGGRAIILVPNDFWMSVGRVFLGLWPPRHPDHRQWITPARLAGWAEDFQIREAYGLPFRSLPFALNMYYFAVLELPE